MGKHEDIDSENLAWHPGPKTRFGMAVAVRIANRSLTRPAGIADRKAVVATACSLDPAGTQLRPHQMEVMACISAHAADEEMGPSAFFSKPTAAGKTPIYCEIMRRIDLLATTAKSHTLATIIVVPGRVLANQIAARLREWAPELDVVVAERTGVPDEITVGTITIMTYARFTSMASRGLIAPEDVDLIIQDEGHRTLSDLRRRVMAPFKGRVYILNATATMAFDEEKNVVSYLGPDNCVHMATNRQMRERGVIAQVINHVIDVRIEGTMPNDRNLAGRMRRMALAKAFVAAIRGGVGDPRKPKMRIDADVMQDQRFVFYAQDVVHALMVRDVYNAEFEAEGLRCEAIWGADSKDETLRKVQAFLAGDLRGLCNVNMIAEGFDDPTIGLVGGSPSASIVLIVQRGGRAQRPFPGEPERIAIVLDFVLTENGRTLGKPKAFFQAIGDEDVVGTPLAFTIRARDCEHDAFLQRRIVEDGTIDVTRRPTLLTEKVDPSDPARRHIPDDAWNAIRVHPECRDSHDLDAKLRRRPLAKRPEDLSLAEAVADPRFPPSTHAVLRHAFASMRAENMAGSATGRFSGALFRTEMRMQGSSRIITIDGKDRDALLAACLRHVDGTTATASSNERRVLSGAIRRATTAAGVPYEDLHEFRSILVTAHGTGEKIVLEDGRILDYRVLRTVTGGHSKPVPFVEDADVARVVDHLARRAVARRRSAEAIADRVGRSELAAEIGVDPADPRLRDAWSRCEAALIVRGTTGDGVDAVLVEGEEARLEMLVARSSARAFDLAWAEGRLAALAGPRPGEVPIHTFEDGTSSARRLSPPARELLAAVEAAAREDRPYMSGPVAVVPKWRTLRVRGQKPEEGFWITARECGALRAQFEGRPFVDPGPAADAAGPKVAPRTVDRSGTPDGDVPTTAPEEAPDGIRLPGTWGVAENLETDGRTNLERRDFASRIRAFAAPGAPRGRRINREQIADELRQMGYDASGRRGYSRDALAASLAIDPAEACFAATWEECLAAWTTGGPATVEGRELCGAVSPSGAGILDPVSYGYFRLAYRRRLGVPPAP